MVGNYFQREGNCTSKNEIYGDFDSEVCSRRDKGSSEEGHCVPIRSVPREEEAGI